jgi:muramoyltetrapeptide carboxypeptidase
MRLLPRLPAPTPKLLVGFSDITALHAWAARAHLVTLHAPVVTQLGALPAEDAQALIDLREGATPPPIEGLRRAAGSGRAEGVLLGGNLEIVSRLAGTPWQLDLDGAILLLEEVGEQPYRIDRALTQLELAGALEGVRGVVIGDLHRCEDRDKPDGPSAEEVIVERLGRLGVPLWLGLPLGHGARNRAVPLGVRVEVADGGLRFLDAAVA